MKKKSLFKRKIKPKTKQEYIVLSERQLMFRKFLKHKVGIIATIILILLYVAIIFANFFAPYGPTTEHNDYITTPPLITKIKFIDNEGNFSVRPFFYKQVMERDPKTLRFVYTDDTSGKRFIRFFVRGENYKMFGFLNSNIHFIGTNEGGMFLFGTDTLGRDLLSRIIFGGRVTLSIGIIGVLIIVILGTIIGIISGYYGGWVDNIIQRLLEVIRIVPQIALWMTLASMMPPEWPSTYTFLGIIIILGFIGWTGLARELRGKVLAIKRVDYVCAAEVSGASKSRIMFKHILPNVSSHILVISTLTIPLMIIAEVSLSFLGLGIRPPMTSWGVLLMSVRDPMILNYYPWYLLPTAFIIMSVLSFNFLGDALRDVIDPYSK